MCRWWRSLARARKHGESVCVQPLHPSTDRELLLALLLQNLRRWSRTLRRIGQHVQSAHRRRAQEGPFDANLVVAHHNSTAAGLLFRRRTQRHDEKRPEGDVLEPWSIVLPHL